MTSWWSRATRASDSAATRTLPRCASAVIGSPRLSRALPPRATTTFIGSRAEGRHHHRLDGVHPVLGLVEDDRALGLEDVVRDLHPVEAVLLEHLLADLRVAVVEGREAVHELHARIAGLPDEVGVDLVRLQEVDALPPHRLV